MRCWDDEPDCDCAKGIPDDAERCTGVRGTAYGYRRCDLTVGHNGVHIRNDACGRPEYYWDEP